MTSSKGNAVSVAGRPTLASGKLVWRKDEFPKVVPEFFTATSAIIVDGMCIAQLGAKDNGAIMAFESRQERTPPTPRVTIFPSATAGELLGPGCREGAPVTACASYLSRHTSLPSAAFKHRVTSSAPCRAKT